MAANESIKSSSGWLVFTWAIKPSLETQRPRMLSIKRLILVGVEGTWIAVNLLGWITRFSIITTLFHSARATSSLNVHLSICEYVPERHTVRECPHVTRCSAAHAHVHTRVYIEVYHHAHDVQGFDVYGSVPSGTCQAECRPYQAVSAHLGHLDFVLTLADSGTRSTAATN